ncbi:MAG: hypothetical protein LBU36_05975 [Clostridiales bacterium]|jgi:hypothetical protein|nr:hypothetical protein [Clostridiales bacterium]
MGKFFKKLRDKLKKRRGAALMLVICVMVFVTLLVLMVSFSVISTTRMSSLDKEQTAASYYSRNAIDMYLESMQEAMTKRDDTGAVLGANSAFFTGNSYFDASGPYEPGPPVDGTDKYKHTMTFPQNDDGEIATSNLTVAVKTQTFEDVGQRTIDYYLTIEANTDLKDTVSGTEKKNQGKVRKSAKFTVKQGVDVHTDPGALIIEKGGHAATGTKAGDDSKPAADLGKTWYVGYAGEYDDGKTKDGQTFPKRFEVTTDLMDPGYNAGGHSQGEIVGVAPIVATRAAFDPKDMLNTKNKADLVSGRSALTNSASADSKFSLDALDKLFDGSAAYSDGALWNNSAGQIPANVAYYAYEGTGTSYTQANLDSYRTSWPADNADRAAAKRTITKAFAYFLSGTLDYPMSGKYPNGTTASGFKGARRDIAAKWNRNDKFYREYEPLKAVLENHPEYILAVGKSDGKYHIDPCIPGFWVNGSSTYGLLSSDNIEYKNEELLYDSAKTGWEIKPGRGGSASVNLAKYFYKTQNYTYNAMGGRTLELDFDDIVNKAIDAGYNGVRFYVDEAEMKPVAEAIYLAAHPAATPAELAAQTFHFYPTSGTDSAFKIQFGFNQPIYTKNRNIAIVIGNDGKAVGGYSGSATGGRESGIKVSGSAAFVNQSGSAPNIGTSHVSLWIEQKSAEMPFALDMITTNTGIALQKDCPLHLYLPEGTFESPDLYKTPGNPHDEVQERFAREAKPWYGTIYAKNFYANAMTLFYIPRPIEEDARILTKGCGPGCPDCGGQCAVCRGCIWQEAAGYGKRPNADIKPSIPIRHPEDQYHTTALPGATGALTGSKGHWEWFKWGICDEGYYYQWVPDKADGSEGAAPATIVSGTPGLNAFAPNDDPRTNLTPNLPDVYATDATGHRYVWRWVRQPNPNWSEGQGNDLTGWTTLLHWLSDDPTTRSSYDKSSASQPEFHMYGGGLSAKIGTLTEMQSSMEEANRKVAARVCQYNAVKYFYPDYIRVEVDPLRPDNTATNLPIIESQWIR